MPLLRYASLRLLCISEGPSAGALEVIAMENPNDSRQATRAGNFPLAQNTENPDNTEQIFNHSEQPHALRMGYF